MKKIKLIIIAILFSISGMVKGQTKAQIQPVLEQFCVDNYNDFFVPRQYVEGTLVVTSVDVDSINSKIRVRGTHTCRGQYIPIIGRMTYAGREFKAELMPASNGTGIKVRFWRWRAPDYGQNNGRWEGPCERIVEP